MIELLIEAVSIVVFVTIFLFIRWLNGFEVAVIIGLALILVNQMKNSKEL